MSPNGEEVEYEFTGPPNGVLPDSGLVEDSVGNLYGTTLFGGDYGYGVVFKIDSHTGNESVLYSFTGGNDGGYPYAVILDSVGNLYGVAQNGGESGDGVVFEMDTAGHETVLHSFSGSDGADPISVLLFDSQGNLYGTTFAGGANSGNGCAFGCGVVFKLSPQPSGLWSETVLYSFCSLGQCADGALPVTGPLVRDSQGNLFGTTERGGSYQNCFGADSGCGVVFELSPAGNETILHNFSGGSDGNLPYAGLAMDASGNLYGTAGLGGDASCYPPNGCGVVFELTP